MIIIEKKFFNVKTINKKYFIDKIKEAEEKLNN